MPGGCEKLHHLLSTPFRYPPLRHGSRFDPASSPACSMPRAAATPCLPKPHTTDWCSGKAWRWFQRRPDDPAHPVRWAVQNGARAAVAEAALRFLPGACWPTLELSGNTGARTAMRGAGVEAFEFRLGPGSGRRHESGHFTPVALSAPRPVFAEAWLCETSSTGVVFTVRAAGRSRTIRSRYFVDGVCPCPQSDGHLVVRRSCKGSGRKARGGGGQSSSRIDRLVPGWARFEQAAASRALMSGRHRGGDVRQWGPVLTPSRANGLVERERKKRGFRRVSNHSRVLITAGECSKLAYPSGPALTSNSTRWFSARVLKPLLNWISRKDARRGRHRPDRGDEALKPWNRHGTILRYRFECSLFAFH